MDGSEARNQAPGGKAAATLESARVASGRSSSSSVALSGGRVGGSRERERAMRAAGKVGEAEVWVWVEGQGVHQAARL